MIKSTFKALPLWLMLPLLAFSCSEEGTQQRRVLIESVNDSVMTVSADGDRAEFLRAGAVSITAEVMANDSAIITYTGGYGGKHSKLLTIQLIEKMSPVIELGKDNGQELLTR